MEEHMETNENKAIDSVTDNEGNVGLDVAGNTGESEGDVGLDVAGNTGNGGNAQPQSESVEAVQDTAGNGEGEPAVDRQVEIVAIPYINDGNESMQMFYGSMFRCGKGNDGEDVINMAQKYFFDCFTNDEQPKWDGVLVCQYDFTNGGVIKDDRNGVIQRRDFKSKWLWNESGSRDSVTFNVKCTMPKVWANHFQSFLREMERYGETGHSGQISFMADGAANFKPHFKFTREYDAVDGIPSSRIGGRAEKMFDAT